MNDVVAVLAILAVAGGLVTRLRLPPLVGYLAAGFVLAGPGGAHAGRSS
ncbi:MAG: hypothetical protein WAV52_01100 [Luteococcus japonicus]